MFLLQSASQVTSDPAGAGSSGGDLIAWLSELYAFPAHAHAGHAGARPSLRVNMISSVDGAATVDGRSGGLAARGDKLIFRVLRGLGDAVLAGASTAVAENYRVPQPDPDFAAARAAAGQSPAPVLVLSSRSLDFPESYAPATADGVLIATCTDAPADRRRRLSDAGATLIDCGTGTVDPHLLKAALAQRGLYRLSSEGGPRLLGDYLATGALDELLVTVSPTAVAGDAPRIAHGAALSEPLRLRPRHILGDGDGYLYIRWVRGEAD